MSTATSTTSSVTSSAAIDPIASSYDAVPYPRMAFLHSHPDTMATLASLLGVPAAPIERCRFLELGCASGSNLIPMAQTLPDSTFVGIDLSPRQIATGQDDCAALGLKNLQLVAQDLMQIDASLGQFDYIVAHGLYSWVPAEVRDRLMAICKAHLAPHGVAYISYNVYPGWHGLDGIRQMMLYHSRKEEDHRQRALQARALLDFLAESVSATDTIYGAMINSHNDHLKRILSDPHSDTDAYLLHEHLEAVNDPVYFHQFAAHAAKHGLQYMCDAEFRTDLPANFPAPVAARLNEFAHDIIELEQYMDFLRHRMFRRTLLCHADLRVERSLQPQRLQALTFCSPALAQSDAPDLHSAAVEVFTARDGATLSLDHPLSKAAFVLMARRWPEQIAFPALVKESAALLRASAPAQGAQPALTDRDATLLAVNLLNAFTYSDNLVEFHTGPIRFALTVEEKPVASPWARLQSLATSRVTNIRHEPIVLDPIELHLLRQLDGAHDRAALLSSLEAAIGSGELLVYDGEQPMTDRLQAVAKAPTLLQSRLERFARTALLMKSA